MSITNKLLTAIKPGKILAVQVGLWRTAVLVETDGEIQCGLAATLTTPGYKHHDRPSVRSAGRLAEMDYGELAALVESESYTEASIGLATINALLPREPDQWVDLNAEDYLIENCPGKSLAVIGHFPFIDRLRRSAKNLWVLELNPGEGDLPAASAPEIVPQADLVAITGTTLINKTFDGLIALCQPKATVVMLGPSTPISPILFYYGVNVVSGTIVNDPRETLLGIGQGISLHQLRQSGWIRYVTIRREGNDR